MGKKHRYEKRRCKHCMRWFWPTRPKQVYHSDVCRNRAYRKRRVERDIQRNMAELVATTNLGELARRARLRHVQHSERN